MQNETIVVSVWFDRRNQCIKLDYIWMIFVSIRKMVLDFKFEWHLKGNFHCQLLRSLTSKRMKFVEPLLIQNNSKKLLIMPNILTYKNRIEIIKKNHQSLYGFCYRWYFTKYVIITNCEMKMVLVKSNRAVFNHVSNLLAEYSWDSMFVQER